jgi:hypothetical protein
VKRRGAGALAARRRRYAQLVSSPVGQWSCRSGAGLLRRRTALRAGAALALVGLACSGTPALAASSGAGEAAAAAAAGSNSFSELSSAATRATSTQRTTTQGSQSNGSSSISTSTVLLALGGALVLLIAIGYVIARDARKVAPAGDGPLGEAVGARNAGARLRKRRARAKAARQQRKRNR